MEKRIMATVLAATMTLSLRAYSGSGRTQGAGSNQAEDAGSNQAEDTGSNQARDTGNGQTGSADSRQPGRENMTFDQMREGAKGTTVTFYDWDGSEKLNRWLDGEFAWVVEEKYNITMERVPMDIGQVLSQLTGEIQAGEKDESINIIWINGENFQSAKESNMLYDPFTDKLPNFSSYVDGENEDVTMDLAYPIEGYEVPYGRTQLVMVAGLAMMSDVPRSAGELKEFVEKYPGKMTCSALPDSTGNAFVRNIIYEIYGYEQFMDMTADRETARAAVAPTMEYLRGLNPYLWNQDVTLPDSSVTADNIFANGELMMSIAYGAYDVTLNTEDGKYTGTTAAFQFGEGTVGNTNFMAIAANSGNKAGVMVATNEMVSPEIQADRYEGLRVVPVLDSKKLSGERKTAFDRVDLGKGTIPRDELLSKRLPRMPAQLVPIIEEIWTEGIVGE